MSPITPIVECVHPPLTVASSTTLSHHGSSPGTSEHEEGYAGGQTAILSSHLRSMPKEPNNTDFPLDYLDMDMQSLWPVYDSVKSSVPIAPQTENSMSQHFHPAAQNPCESEDTDVPSVSTQPHHLRMYPSDPEAFIQSYSSEKVLEAEKSSSMTQSVVTEVCAPRPKNPGFSPISFSSRSPPQNRPTQPDSKCAINIQSPPEATRPSSAFHIPPFSRSLSRQTAIVTGPVMEMGDFDNSDTNYKTWSNQMQDPHSVFQSYSHGVLYTIP